MKPPNISYILKVLFLSTISLVHLLGIKRTEDFKLSNPEFEVTLWAESPLFYNPTNFDVDAKGRIWVTEGVNTEEVRLEQVGTVVVLEDTDLDGTADKSTVLFKILLVAPGHWCD